MKKIIFPLYIVVLLILLTTSGCKKPKGDPGPQDDPELPPKTQTGANTFGCRVNGVAWTPKGSPFSIPAISVSYDPNFYWGTLNITINRVTESGRETMVLGSDSIKVIGNYPLTKPNRQEALFLGKTSDCWFYQGENQERTGSMTITKFDLQNAIISGTFEFTLKKPSCTIVVTNGRFDLKL